MAIDFISSNILSLLIFFPLVVAAIVGVLPSDHHGKFLLKIVGISVFLEFVLSLHLVRYFVPSTHNFQFSEFSQWTTSAMNLYYIVGVDGFSLSLVVLSTAISLLVFLTIKNTIKTYLRGFLVLFLILESTLVGVFTSLNVLQFYIFWEASLIPLYFMIGMWGGPNRTFAALKFFIYGVIGSLFMLLAFAYLYYKSIFVLGYYSANILNLYNVASRLPEATQELLFLAILLAFGIKAPLFPFYTWLTDVYEQAPAVYTLMSGVVLKLATYGLVRFGLCLFPAVAARHSSLLMSLATIGLLYGALIAWQQSHLRRIMAFSSLSHMSFILLGLFSLNSFGIEGALYQMLNHTITAAGLFVLFNFIYERKKSFDINDYGGLAKNLPWFAFFFVVIVMGSVALPSTGNFIGEWLILLGAFQTHKVIGAVATLGVIFGAIYMLWVTYKIIFGPLGPDPIRLNHGLRSFETFQLFILCLFIFGLGFTANPILQHTRQTIFKMEMTLQKGIPYQAVLTKNNNGKLTLISLAEGPSHHVNVVQLGEL